MISIGKCRSPKGQVSPKAAAREAAAYLVDYASEHGLVGRWRGEGAARLGLSGDVDAEELINVIAGFSPDGKTALLPRQIAESRSVLALDITHSKPKSLSLLQALTTDPDIAATLRDAEDVAVVAAQRYLEDVAGKLRRGHAGAESIESTGLITAAFKHSSSRAGDPQYHEHNLTVAYAEGRRRQMDLPGRPIVVPSR